MNADVQKLLALVSDMLQDKNIDILKEMGIRHGVDILSTKTFEEFELKYPDSAEYLRELSGRNTKLSNAILYATGAVLNQMPGVKGSDISTTAISDLLSGIRRQFINIKRGNVSTIDYGDLGKKIFQLSPDRMLEFVKWQKDFDDETRSLVYASLVDKTPDEINEFMQLDEKNRLEMLLFLKSCEIFGRPDEDDSKDTNPEAKEKTDSPFVVGIQNLRIALENKKQQIEDSSSGKEEVNTQ